MDFDASLVTYVQMTEGHIDCATQLCVEEKWNVDSKLLNRFYQDFPAGSFVAVIQHRVIGTHMSQVPPANADSKADPTSSVAKQGAPTQVLAQNTSHLFDGICSKFQMNTDQGRQAR